MLSQKTKYALKSLVLLAKEEQSKKSSSMLISDLAKKGHMPQKFLEAILLELKNHGILQSKKGKGGGYSLARPAQEIMLGNVVRILEGPLALLPCAQASHRPCEECKTEEGSGIRILFREVRDATSQILDNTSVAKVLEVEEKAKDKKALVYFI